MTSVTVAPEEALFAPDTLALSSHSVSNPGSQPLAIKVKCSDNDLYRLRPVFAILPPGGELCLQLVRLPAPAKLDCLEVQSLACPDGTKEAALPDLFRANPDHASVVLDLISADALLAAPP